MAFERCGTLIAMGSGDQIGRVLSVRIGGEDGGRAHYVPARSFFSEEWGRFAQLAPLGGSAMTLGLVQRSPAGLALTIGGATRRGLPSSGRVHIGAVSPLTGAYTEGAVGGDLVWALAGLADGLVLERGAELAEGAPGAPAVLVVGPADELDGLVDRVGLHLFEVTSAGPSGAAGLGDAPAVGLLELEQLLGPGAAQLGTRALGQALQAALGGAPGDGLVRASILCGPAARAGLPYTTLVTGGDVPLVTGRGGLGARLASLGLAAVFVVGPPSDSMAPERRAPSPRLAERARAGTFELFGAFAARGELSGRNYASFLSVEEGRAIAAEASADRSAQHGCKGCPTPCGLVFDRPGKGDGKQRGGARFSATWALGPNLGFPAEAAGDRPSAFRAALALLERCDDLGLDAREAGACLALLSRAAELGRPAPDDRGGGARFGDLDCLSAALEQLPPLGSAALARELGLEHEHFDAQGQSARPEGSLASVLGQVVSTGGNDPLRAFPFTVARGRFDPREPAGKGRLVAWHEDLAAALDLSGFCGFSAAGLLVDGVLDLDELAAWILPELASDQALAATREAEPGDAPGDQAAPGSDPSPGAVLLEAGRCLVLARRRFNESLGLAGGLAPDDLPAWSRGALLAPGMLDEYLVERGLDGAGRLAPATRGWLAGEGSAPWPPLAADLPRGDESESPADEAGTQQQGSRPATALGEVTLSATGRLGELLGTATFELALPASLAEVLAHAAAQRPAAADLLFDRSGRPLPAAWRERHPVAPRDLVHAGDRLDLLLAIAGG